MTYPASGDAPERAGDREAGLASEPVEGAPATAPEAQHETAGPAPERDTIPKTRTALLNNALLAFAVVLILLLVFILENTKSVKISYFGAGFHLPLGVALLLAAIAGALLMGLVGAARILQLRRHVRRRR